MRKSFTILCLLLVILGVEWGVKAKMPINRPSNIQEKEETPWYESRYSTPKADADWVLDEEIPVNYIPVPGKDNIYMQVDNNGNVKNIGKGLSKQMVRGSGLNMILISLIIMNLSKD